VLSCSQHYSDVLSVIPAKGGMTELLPGLIEKLLERSPYSTQHNDLECYAYIHYKELCEI